MADLAEHIWNALAKYWSSPIPQAILFGTLACIGTLVYVFFTNARNAKLRVSLLTGLYSLSIFFWTFVVTSLTFCLGLSSFVAYNRIWGVPLAAGGAVLTSFALSGVVSFVVWRRGAERLLRSIATRAPKSEEQWLVDYVALVGRFESLPSVELRIAEDPKPLAMAVSGKRHVAVVSTGLLAS